MEPLGELHCSPDPLAVAGVGIKERRRKRRGILPLFAWGEEGGKRRDEAKAGEVREDVHLRIF